MRYIEPNMISDNNLEQEVLYKDFTEVNSNIDRYAYETVENDFLDSVETNSFTEISETKASSKSVTLRSNFIPNYTPLEGLNGYFTQIAKYPMLSEDEEYTLARRYRDTGDVYAAQKLVCSHLRLVASMAIKYRSYGLPIGDLISEGNIGLMKAVKKFDPEKGFRLSTYAMWWIKASIGDFVLRSWSLVRLGTLEVQKKLFFSLRRIKERLNIFDDGELTVQEKTKIAKEFDVSGQDVQDFNNRLMTRDLSINTPVAGSDGSVTVGDILVSNDQSIEDFVEKKDLIKRTKVVLSEILLTMPERDRQIFIERHTQDNPPSLEDIGQRMGISRERVRQIEKRAYDFVMDKLRMSLNVDR